MPSEFMKSNLLDALWPSIRFQEDHGFPGERTIDLEVFLAFSFSDDFKVLGRDDIRTTWRVSKTLHGTFSKDGLLSTFEKWHQRLGKCIRVDRDDVEEQQFEMNVRFNSGGLKSSVLFLPELNSHFLLRNLNLKEYNFHIRVNKEYNTFLKS